ncbi:hypothetical protein IKG07_00225 [Candidatus Saccharibacteria bacterium]|nr:hypothetical protein [Candidatus Saccharibacteria bacterium]
MFACLFQLAVMTFLALTAGRMLGVKLKFRVVNAVALGVGAALIRLAPKAPAWVAMILLAADLTFMVFIALWWKQNGSTWKEMIVFALMDLMLMWVGLSAAARILNLTDVRWLIGLIRALPAVAFVLSIGFFILNRMIFEEKLRSDEFDLNEYLYEYGEDDEDDECSEPVLEVLRRWWSDEEGYNDYNYSNTCDRARDC